MTVYQSWPDMSCGSGFMMQMSKGLWGTLRMPDIQGRKVTSRTLTVENRFTVPVPRLMHLLVCLKSTRKCRLFSFARANWLLQKQLYNNL